MTANSAFWLYNYSTVTMNYSFCSSCRRLKPAAEFSHTGCQNLKTCSAIRLFLAFKYDCFSLSNYAALWVELQQRKLNPEKTQPINSNSENSGLTQYIQIVIIAFSPSFLPSNKAVFSPSNMAISRLLIWLLSHLLIWSLSHLLIWPFLTF